MSTDAEARRRKGFDDGYRVGPDGIEPDGKPAITFYDTDLFGDPDYQRGLSAGRAKRIDDGGQQQRWPLTGAQD